MTDPTQNDDTPPIGQGSDIAELSRIFLQVAEVPKDRQEAMLAELCPDNDFRQRVRDLLDADSADDPLLDHSLFPEPFQVQVGEDIDGYKLLQEIARGGMGVVFMAEQQEPVRRTVAIKVIKPGVDTREVIARFDAERQALSMMDHPNIAKVLDAGTTDAGRPYFVMELVKGQPITTYCDQNKLSARKRLELFLPVCHAIQHAHQKGIIHRDIKPSNVLIAEYDGRPVAKVIDFGIAKAINQTLTEMTVFTGFGQIIGTFDYMSPEQSRVNQLDVDTRSDIYSLGVLLYELLTGSPPFDKERLRSVTWEEMLRIIREEEPPRLSSRLSGSTQPGTDSKHEQNERAKLGRMVRGELDWIVMKAMEKDRNRRYETPNEFANDIECYLNGDAVAACPPSPMYLFRKFARRNKVAIATSTIVAASLVFGLIGITWQAVRALRAEEATETINKYLIDDVLDVTGGDSQLSAGLRANSDLKLVTLLESARSRVNNRFGDRPQLRARLKSALAKSFASIRRYDVAAELFEESLEYLDSEKGRNHSETILVVEQLVKVYLEQSRLTKAENLCVEALKNSRQVLGQEDNVTLSLMDSLATLYQKQKLYQKAQSTHNECLDIKLRLPQGDQRLSTLSTMSKLGITYESLDRLEDAEALHSKVLTGRRSLLDEGHQLIADALHHQGRCCLNLGRQFNSQELFNRSAGYLEESLDLNRQIAEEISEPNSNRKPDPTVLVSDLAHVYLELQRYQDAIPLLSELVERLSSLPRSYHGSDDERTLEAPNMLGWVYMQQGRLEEAENILFDALQMGLQENPRGRSTLQLMINLAIAYRRIGKIELAIAQEEKASILAKELLGQDHAETLASMTRLGLCYLDAGRASEGRSLLEKVYRAEPNLPATGSIKRKLAASYAEDGEYQKARLWLESADQDPAERNPQQ